MQPKPTKLLDSVRYTLESVSSSALYIRNRIVEADKQDSIDSAEELAVTSLNAFANVKGLSKEFESIVDAEDLALVTSLFRDTIVSVNRRR